MGLVDEVCAKLQELELNKFALEERVRELERENDELKARVALAKEHTRDVLKYLGGEYVGPI